MQLLRSVGISIKKISLQNCQPNELYQNFYFLSIDKNVGLKLDIFAGFSNTVWCWMTTFIYRGAHTMYWYFGCAWAWVFHKYKKRNCQRTFLAFLFYITTDSIQPFFSTISDEIGLETKERLGRSNGKLLR